MLSASYAPRALAACAHALRPLACRAAAAAAAAAAGDADQDGEGGEGGEGGGEAGVEGATVSPSASHPSALPLTALRLAAQRLVAQSAPRPGEVRELLCADQARVRVRVPRPLMGGQARPRVPEAAESCAAALSPLSASGVSALLTALLLEQKVVLVSSRPARLTAAAQAASALLHPLRWSQVYVPLVPRSHLSVAGAPFPYVLGVPAHLLPALGRAAPSVGAGGELWVWLDEGLVQGAPP